MKTLKQYLEESAVDDALASLFLDLAEAVKKISALVKSSHGEKAGSENAFGEEQLALDVQSDGVLQSVLKNNRTVGLYASEESNGEITFGEGEFAVCADPLDGSSLVDVNLAVGSIIGIYKAKSFIGQNGGAQLASMIALYGPRTTLMLTVKKGVYEFVLTQSGDFMMSRENLKIGDGKMFAPGNLKACEDNTKYLELVRYWCENDYTLRYSGGMVPDVNQILVKGKGVFIYPASKEKPEGKLRLLYECAPIALLIDQADGYSSDGQVSILEKVLGDVDQTTPVILGSRTEVEKCKEFLA